MTVILLIWTFNIDIETLTLKVIINISFIKIDVKINHIILIFRKLISYKKITKKYKICIK